MNIKSRKSEYLDIAPEIQLLAGKVLAPKELKEADEISENIASVSTRKRAINLLRQKVGMKPKRPIYYAHYELTHLPRWTRNVMRYLGDYIDQLVKFLTAEKLNDGKYLARSLGSNVKSLTDKNILPKDFLNVLAEYNNLLYVPAKHDFDVKNRTHRFTSREVVYACFITMKLGKQLISFSDRAKEYAKERIHEFYVYDETTKSDDDDTPLWIKFGLLFKVFIYKLRG